MSFAHQAIKTISRIPKGKVATYGQIAALAGSPRAARMVGWILSRSGETLPWHRVISSRGRISITNLAYSRIKTPDFSRGITEGVLEDRPRRGFYDSPSRKSRQDVPASWQVALQVETTGILPVVDHPAELQAQLLKKEGVKVAKHGHNYSVDLAKYLWRI